MNKFILKYFIAFFVLLVNYLNAQPIIFHETFGTSTTREASQYVPQGGKDVNLGFSSYTCSSFYYPAIATFAIKPTCTIDGITSYNNYVYRISDGYYTVINPLNKPVYSSSSPSFDQLPDWAVTDAGRLGDSGAGMIVNAGLLKNQYYRRAVKLERNKSYKVSFKVLSSSRLLPNEPKRFNSVIEVQNSNSEIVLGTSSQLLTDKHNQWETKSWTFRTPDSLECSEFYAISLRNNNPVNQGNDFYVDNIILEEVVDASAPVISCSSSASDNYHDLIIKANDDNIANFNTSGFTYNILANDRLNNGALGQGFVFSGINKTASIATIGNWPSGISINNQGQLVVSSEATTPTLPLEYQICNLIGVCSKAKIYFNTVDLSLNVTASTPCLTSSQSTHTQNYVFKIKNEGTASLSLSTQNQIKVRASLSSGTTFDWMIASSGTVGTSTNWKWEKDSNNVYTFSYPASSTVNLAADAEISFTIDKSFTLSTLDRLRVLNATLEYSSDQFAGNNSSSATVYYVLDSAPGNKIHSFDYNQGKTIAELAGVSTNLNQYRFYVDNQLVSYDYWVDPNFISIFSKEYKYSLVNGSCESEKSSIYIGPHPGAITASATTVCFGGSVTINNSTPAAQGGYILVGGTRYALKHTWEISYDNGLTWGIPPDTSGDDTSGAASVTISDIKSNFLIRRKAHERPTSTRTNKYNYTTPIAITVSNNKIIFPTGFSTTIAAIANRVTHKANVELPLVTTTLVNSTIKYKNPAGVVIATNPTASVSLGELNEGEYFYEIIAENTIAGSRVCETKEIIRVIVYNAYDCDKYVKRLYANHAVGWSTGLSAVSGTTNAVEITNKASHATLTGGVVLLGIGTVGIDLYFRKPDNTIYAASELKGKKIVIKLGEEYSGLKLAGGISVIGIKSTINSPSSMIDGTITSNTFGVKGGVLDALKGDNVFEYSFTPSNSSGTVEFNGVRVQLGSLLGIADLAKVFYAYIEEESTIENPVVNTGAINTQTYCNMIAQPISITPSTAYPSTQVDVDNTNLTNISNVNITLNNFTDDAMWGNYTEVANVASGLSSVIYPYYAVDNNYDSYTLFNRTASVLNRQFLQVKLRQKARLGDQLQITLAYPNINILNLSLLQLGNFKVVYYLKGAKVGEEKLEEFRVLDIGLFNFRNKRRAIISKPVNFMFDKVEVQQFNTVTLEIGDGLHIHDIRINPLKAFVGMNDPKEVTNICANEYLRLQKLDPCTEYQISFARVTEYGPEYVDSNNMPLLDYKGRPIKSIYSVQDIPNSNLIYLQNISTESMDYFDLNILNLYNGPDYDGKLLIKIQTKRQGCDFGDPQYLRIDLENCIQGVVNPVIQSTAKY